MFKSLVIHLFGCTNKFDQTRVGDVASGFRVKHYKAYSFYVMLHVRLTCILIYILLMRDLLPYSEDAGI